METIKNTLWEAVIKENASKEDIQAFIAEAIETGMLVIEKKGADENE